MQKSNAKNKFTLRIILSYAILGGLALIAGIFILSEVKTYLANDTVNENDIKFLKTSVLLTQLYEAESLSKLALQSKTRENFRAYADKINEVSAEIDTLKSGISSAYQLKLLDSVQQLLVQKRANNEELRRIKLNNQNNSSLDSALDKFNSMELSLGSITAKAIVPNIDELSPEAKIAIEKLVVVLNENIPKENKGDYSTAKIDSIIAASKKLLSEAKNKDAFVKKSLAKTELEIYKNDLELSQQLRSIINAFEQEIIQTTVTVNQQKQAVLTRSIRLAGIAALLGILVVGFFTFLITRDYWRVQTYRQHLEEEKKFSESLLKSREQLISTVSHDLRTPLHTITGYTELLENTSLRGKQNEYLKNINSAAQYITNLVNDLLDYSKLEAGKLKTEAIPFILHDVITETALNLKEINAKKSIKLSLEIAEDLHQTLIGDPFRIRQIVTNLISNAYKFTENGTIKIVVSLKNLNIEKCIATIHVIDSGIGIAKEKQALIFKEFTQAEDTTEKKYGGYGLGLTISKKLASLLGGNLQLKSELGKGSEFSLIIPLEYAENELKNQQKQLIQPIQNKLALLILDDDSSMLGLLKEVCNTLGIIAHTFSNFDEILASKSLKYDAVLTDIQMPKMDGFEVLQQFKNGCISHYTKQPILAMTGRKDLEKSSYLEAGFIELLQKPFSKTTLINQLAILFPEKFQLVAVDTSKSDLKNSGRLYGLDILISFLGNNNEGIQEVVQTFLKETTKNRRLLNEAIHLQDIEQINAVAHRMLPMFRQLEAQKVIAILAQLETLNVDELPQTELKNLFAKLNIAIDAFTRALKKDPIIAPIYND